MNKWWSAGAVLSVVVMSSGCMMSQAGVRAWASERALDQAAAVSARVQVGDGATAADVGVDVLQIVRDVNAGYLRQWWEFAQVNPWPAVWRGGVDLGLDALGVFGVAKLAGWKSDGGSDSAPAEKPLPTQGASASATVSGEGNTVTQTININPAAAGAAAP